MEEIMVSVYCLAYNHEKYIRNALEGFVTQKTNFAYEVWVHDDASKDGTAGIIQEYADRYPDIIKPILQKENQCSKGINSVITHIYPKMQGKYIAVCEGDDYWCCMDKLQRQVDFLETHGEYSACVHNTIQVDCRTGKESLINASMKDMDLRIELIFQHGNAQFQISSLMYRREYFIRPKEFYAKGFGDYPIAIYLAMVGKIRYFKEIMSVYRLHADGSWTSRSDLQTDSKTLREHVCEIEKMLNGIDQYSEGRYHEIITSVIAQYRYRLLIKEKDYRKIANDRDVKKIYLKTCHSYKEKVMFYINAYSPGISTFYYKLKKRKNDGE